MPIVAAIHGYCIGGGFDLALACHGRIAAPDAVSAHPGGSLGILTGRGGTQRLTRLTGCARALEMLTTACKLDAHEALAAGLIRQMVPELLAAANGVVWRVRNSMNMSLDLRG